MFWREKRLSYIFSYMILISLNGGLGNQLFQYALGRRLSYERNVSLRFDLSLLETATSTRRYKLNYFHIQGKPADVKEKAWFYYPQTSKWLSVIQSFLPYYRRRIVNEQTPVFDSNIFRTPSTVLLQGYWQSQNYFLAIREILCKDLQLIPELDSINQALFDSIRNTHSVSVHIRRGDYVHDPETNKAHGVLPLSYYESAFRFVKEKVQQPHFYVFSDDIAWARENICGLERVNFVDHNSPSQDYFDFSLMKECKFHITANSSFSWWAAWLSFYENKIVIAPRRWYQSGQDTRDLIPTEWIKL